MNDDKEQTVADPSAPEPETGLEDDEMEDLRRELNDDEVARIAGGVCGTNETHTKTPTSA
jgi:methionine synthase I (cobalamin-dependent)